MRPRCGLVAAWLRQPKGRWRFYGTFCADLQWHALKPRGDWAVIDLAEPGPGHRQLLIRRNRTTGELACYCRHSTRPDPLTTLVRVAGSRWRVGETALVAAHSPPWFTGASRRIGHGWDTDT
ncbi:hypothetical protein [Streptomyces sp. NPDC057729]|uniref:hypothetical protein n=1 Tax=Streptomyces sp. NPDC057729 TaxID=3346230 RepID=UPI0036CD5A53